MRIIIDTKENKIICPKPFWDEVQKKKDIIREVNGEEEANKITHHEEVRKYFEAAIKNELVRPTDVKKKS